MRMTEKSIRAFLTLLLLCAAPSVFAHSDSPRVGKLLEASDRYMMTDPHASVQFSERAISLLEQHPSRSGLRQLGKSFWLSAEANLRLGNLPRANRQIHKAFEISSDLTLPAEIRGKMFLTKGVLEMKTSRVALALESLQEAYRIFQAAEYDRGRSLALMNIAWLYSSSSNLRQAIKYYEDARQAYNADPRLLMALHNNMASVFLQQNKFALAVLQYRNALRYSKELNASALRAIILKNLAHALVSAGQISEAHKSIESALRLENSSTSVEERSKTSAIIAEIAFARGDVQTAVALADRALEGIDTETTSADFRYVHLIAYQIYSSAGLDHRALVNLQAIRRLEDEAAKVASTTNAALAAARFDYKNQELRIAKLKADDLRRNVAYERSQARFERIIFVGVGGTAFLLVILLATGFVMIRRSRNETRAANGDLAATNVALERALAAKTEFLATTSHEIRTPLNGILGMTQVMLADANLPMPTRERLGVVHGAGTAMRVLVDDILDVAKMESGNLLVDRVPMDLERTLRETVPMWREQAVAKGIAFEFDFANAPRSIESDPARIRQIVANLLSNALKFTSRGYIAVRVSRDDVAPNRLRIEVEDSGIGISADKQTEIFESFRQVDPSTTRKYGGTGLGLTICRNLARALGGDISVASVPGEGATFTLDLPYEPATAPSGAQAADSAVGGVLVFDRNPISQGMWRALFKPVSQHVTFAIDVDDVCAAIGRREHACLLIDDATIAADGDDRAVMERIVKATRDAATLVVLLCAGTNTALRDTAYSVGVGRIIDKPIAGSVLVERLFGAKSAAPLVSHAA